MICGNCGKWNLDTARFCIECGSPLIVAIARPNRPPRVIDINVEMPHEQQKNSVGTAGFVLSLVSLFMGWIPFFGWILWLVGIVLSIVGAFRMPRRFAIAGIAISGVALVFMFVVLFNISITSSSYFRLYPYGYNL